MKKQLLFTIFFSSLSLFLLGEIKQSYAAKDDYAIQPIIVIPANMQKGYDEWNNAENFTGLFNSAFTDINQKLSEETNGELSFNYEPLQIVGTDKTTDDIAGIENFCKLVFEKKTFDITKFPEGKRIFVVAGYGIGSLSIGGRGGDNIKGKDGKGDPMLCLEFNQVLSLSGYNHKDNPLIYEQTYKPRQDQAVNVLAHELGHTVGLAMEGFTKNGHTCSETNTDYCKPETTKPLPDVAYGKKSIMNYQGCNNWQLCQYNNDDINPEIQTLYKSNFLNTNAAPPPTKSWWWPFNVKLGGIETISPKSIDSGKEITITGSGFAKNPGQLSAYPVTAMGIDFDNPINTNAIQNIRWSDEKLQFTLLNDKAEDIEVAFQIKTANDNTYISTENQSVTVSASKQAEYVVTNNFTTTCGDKDIKFSDVSVQTQKSTDGSNWQTIQEAVTDMRGEGSISMLIPTDTSSFQYRIVADDIGGVTAETNQYAIDLPNSPTTDLSNTYTFRYKKCPEGYKQKRDITLTVNGETWEDLNEAFSLTLDPQTRKDGKIPTQILVTYIDDDRKERQRVFYINFDYTKPTPQVTSSQNPPNPGDSDPDDGSEIKLPSGKTVKICSYTEPFEDKKMFKSCSKGERSCKGTENSDGGCEYSPSVTKREKCKVTSCDDPDYTPEPTQEVKPTEAGAEPTEPGQRTGTCNYREEFDQLFDGCEDGVKTCQGIWDNDTCVYDKSGEVPPACVVKKGDCKKETSDGETCSYNEKFEGSFGDCENGGIRKCTGSYQGNKCKYDPDIEPNCGVISCN